MPTWLLAVLFLVVWPLAAVGGLLWARGRVGAAVLRPHHEVAGYIVAVVGVVYGVVSGTMVVAVWTDFEEARQAVTAEVSHLFTLHRLADGMPERERLRLESAVADYAAAVVADEWPAMAAGRSSARASRAADAMWAAVRDDPARDAHSGRLQEKALDVVARVTELRRTRLLLSGTGLPPYLWLALGAGALITVLFAYLFGVDSARLHMVMVWLLALIIGLNLFVIAAVDLPFTGDVQVPPTGFDMIQETLEPGLE